MAFGINEQRLCKKSFVTASYLENFLEYMNDKCINENWTKCICTKFCELFILNYSIVVEKRIDKKNDTTATKEAVAENEYLANASMLVTHNDSYDSSTNERETAKEELEGTERSFTISYSSDTDKKQRQEKQTPVRTKTAFTKFFQIRINADKILLLFKCLLHQKLSMTEEEWNYNDVLGLLHVLVTHFNDDCETFMEILQRIVFHMLTPSFMVRNKKLRELIYTDGAQLKAVIEEPILPNSKIKSIFSIVKDFARENNIEESKLSKITSILKRIEKRIQTFLRNKTRNENYGGRFIKKLKKKVKVSTTFFQDELKLGNDICNLLLLLGIAVFEKFEMTPNPTQYLSCILLLFSINYNNVLKFSAIKGKYSRLLEVKTGEGKSCIIAMVAATYAIMGRSVDIVTSSTELAKRDSANWEPFYQFLDLSVSCNSILHVDYNKCYECNVVYGTAGDFSRDILQTKFFFKAIRQNRKNDVVLVDEVDSLMIDQGIERTYLEDNISQIGLSHVEPLLSLIWYRVRQFGLVKDKLSNMIFYYGPVKPLFDIVLDIVNIPFILGPNQNLIDNTTSNYIDELLGKYFRDGELSIIPYNETAVTDFFKDVQVFLKISIKLYRVHEGTITKFFGADEEDDADKVVDVDEEYVSKPAILIMLLDDGMASILTKESQLKEDLTKQLRTYIDSSKEREESCIFDLPGFVKTFISKRIEDWICSAFCAMRARENREYVVINGNAIHPVDFLSTGVVELNKKWSNGMQQFLEMKHLLPLTPMQCINNYISNIKFFNTYECLLGVSGTLGVKALLKEGEELTENEEQKFLAKYYNIRATDCYTIPRSYNYIFFEYSAILLDCEAEWIAAIEARTKVEIDFGRSVLILCEDIDTAKKLEKRETLSYCRNDLVHETQNIDKEINDRKIIISTNLGSRGTDYRITQDLLKAGGLFVIVTFLPINERIQQQAFGRTARKGKCGSAQLILNRENLPDYFKCCKTVDEIKDKRKSFVEEHIVKSQRELHRLAIKEELFDEFLRQLDQVRIELVTTTKVDAVTVTFLNILRQKIAMWIEDKTETMWIEDKTDTKNVDLTDHKVTDKLKKELNENLNKEKIDTTFDDNFYYALIFTDAKLLQGEDYRILKDVKQYYTGVKRNFLKWSSFALYNRASLNNAIYSKRAEQNMDESVDLIVTDLEIAIQNIVFYKAELLLTYVLVLLSQKSLDEDKISPFIQWIVKRFLALSHFEHYINQNIKEFKEGNNTSKFLENKVISALYQSFRIKNLTMIDANINIENVLLFNITFITVAEVLEFNKNKLLIIKEKDVKEVIKRVMESIFERNLVDGKENTKLTAIDERNFNLVWKTVSQCLLYRYERNDNNQLKLHQFMYNDEMISDLSSQIIRKLLRVRDLIQIKADVLNGLKDNMKKITEQENEDSNTQSKYSDLDMDNMLFINVNKMLQTDIEVSEKHKLCIQQQILEFLNAPKFEKLDKLEISKKIILPCLNKSSKFLSGILTDRLQMLDRNAQLGKQKYQLEYLDEKLSENYQKWPNEDLLDIILFASIFWLQIIILDVNYEVKYVVNHDWYKKRVIVINESTAKKQSKYKIVKNGRYDENETSDNILLLLCSYVNNLLKEDFELRNFYRLALKLEIAAIDANNVHKFIGQELDNNVTKYEKILKTYNFIKYNLKTNLPIPQRDKRSIFNELIQQKLTIVHSLTKTVSNFI